VFSNAGADTLDGSTSAAAVTVYGGAGDDSITGSAFNDDLRGDAGDDVIRGGADADALHGGAGRDAASYENSTGGVTIWLETGTGTGGDAEGDTFDGIEDLVGSLSIDQLTGDANANRFSGGDNHDILNGAAGDDELLGGSGNDVLEGGSGDDLYQFGRGFDADVIIQDDAFSSYDRLSMGPGVRIDQIWFDRVADDLRVSVIGTGDQVTVQNWYTDPAHQLDGFFAVEGFRQMGAYQVDQLVSAMAVISAPPAGQFELTQEQHAALDLTLAAAWY
jgi:Ca2+-binding RTX toxin-like protein